MANYNTNHLEREIESLRRQLIKERDERQYEDSMRITTVIKQAELRVLERCIVECMEEANAIPYSDDERVAILTAAERLKEMRDERVKEREERDAAERNEQMRAAQNRMLNEQMKHKMYKVYNEELNRQLSQAMISGKSITSMVMDEADTVRWSNISNPEEWMK
jgi:hypothetical protein